MRAFLQSLRQNLDWVAVGAAFALLAFAGSNAFFQAPPLVRPVDILAIQPTHPVLAGKNMRVTITAFVRRRCAATARWYLINDEGARVWSHTAQVGYSEPRPEPITVPVTLSTPMPDVLPDGRYTLVTQREEHCTDGEIRPEPQAWAIDIP